MTIINVKHLKEVLEFAPDDALVKVYCSYNQYNVKRVSLYNGNIIIDLGDADNPIEEYDNNIRA